MCQYRVYLKCNWSIRSSQYAELMTVYAYLLRNSCDSFFCFESPNRKRLVFASLVVASWTALKKVTVGSASGVTASSCRPALLQYHLGNRAAVRLFPAVSEARCHPSKYSRNFQRSRRNADRKWRRMISHLCCRKQSTISSGVSTRDDLWNGCKRTGMCRWLLANKYQIMRLRNLEIPFYQPFFKYKLHNAGAKINNSCGCCILCLKSCHHARKRTITAHDSLSN